MAKKVTKKKVPVKGPFNRKSYGEQSLERDWNDLPFAGQRARVFHEQNNQCNVCGITEWNSMPIKLKYHHIDGHADNNTRDNVEAICPNCFSQKVKEREYRGKKTVRKLTKLAPLIK